MWTTNAARRRRRREESKHEMDAISDFFPVAGTHSKPPNNDAKETMYKHHFRTRGASYINSFTINIPWQQFKSFTMSFDTTLSSSRRSSLSSSRSTRHLLLKHRQTLKRIHFWCLFSPLAILLMWIGWQLCVFYAQATHLCTPPAPGYEENSGRPLVEYYIHGHGNGHYSRSLAIVQHLNKNGVDVRMFLSSKHASTWKALQDDKNSEMTALSNNTTLGSTSTIPVVSLTPELSLLEIVSVLRDRILTNCEASAMTTTTTATRRYPHLVVSDGDLPGMLRAYMGGIPSISIGHGLFFHIAQKPSFVRDDAQLNRAWNRQSRLSGRASAFSKFLIGTHFCNSESEMPNGIVARPPLRPEILEMADYRKQAQNGQTLGKEIPRMEHVMSLLPFGSDIDDDAGDDTVLSTKPRKLIICYFRDQNGESVIRALLDEGFDVVVFNRSSDYTDDKLVDEKGFLRNNQQQQQKSPVNTGESGDNDGDGDLPRVISVKDPSLFVPLMHIADGVASSAGSNVMSECMYSRTPLLALYMEHDGEERLNVELSRNDPACHKPKVFGTSFERLQSANNHEIEPLKIDDVELAAFVQEVHSSKASEIFYQNINKTVALDDQDDHDDHDDDDDDDDDNTLADNHATVDLQSNPFHGLPDAAPFVVENLLDIIKEFPAASGS